MGTATHEALQQQLYEGVSHEFTRAAPAHLAQERGREWILFPEQLELMLALEQLFALCLEREEQPCLLALDISDYQPSGGQKPDYLSDGKDHTGKDQGHYIDNIAQNFAVVKTQCLPVRDTFGWTNS